MATTTRTTRDGKITSRCAVCRKSKTAKDKGLGRATIAAWETQHQHIKR